jgi:protocatechuate 4,5-dioxygenase beta chain
MQVDHAFTLPMALLWPDQKWPVKVVPVCINTVQFPLPSAARCYKLGEAIGRAVAASRDSDARVLVLGTGGLSAPARRRTRGLHQQGLRPAVHGKPDADPTWATQYSIHELVEKTGTQGVELLMWLAARGALGEKARKLHANYHIPISNTAAGLMLLEPA